MPSEPTHAPLTVAARPELTGDRRIGVLLSHGFTGSPASMRPWGEFLADLGYGVRVPLLPGHGTSWQDLNRHTWKDWYDALVAELDAMLAEHDAVVVGGLSMGGALVLQLAADRPDDVAGVMVVNPAIATKRFDVRLLPLIKHVVRSFPGIADNIKKEGVQEHGYTRTPLKAIHSLIQAWKPLVEDLPHVKAPLIYFRSRVDKVVDEASEPLIRDRVSSTDVTMVPLEDSFHVATLDNDAPLIFERSAEFVARVTAG